MPTLDIRGAYNVCNNGTIDVPNMKVSVTSAAVAGYVYPRMEEIMRSFLENICTISMTRRDIERVVWYQIRGLLNIGHRAIMVTVLPSRKARK